MVSLFTDVLYEVRANDDIVTHTYLTKYKEKVFSSLSSPHCYFNSNLACFMVLEKMEVKPDVIELLTSTDELEALSEVFGAEGHTWLISKISEHVSASIAKLLHIVKDNITLLNEPRDKDDIWKQLANAPEFILTGIDIGKKLGFLQLLCEAHENVTKNHIEFMHKVVDMMINSEMSNLLGVPDNIETIASGLGQNLVRQTL